MNIVCKLSCADSADKLHEPGTAVVSVNVCDIVNVPVIASGGAGGKQDFVDLFNTVPGVSAGLAASIFHYGEVAVNDLKKTLKENNITVRL